MSAADAMTMPTVLKGAGVGRAFAVVRGLLTVGLVVLIFGLVIPKVGDYHDAWNHLTSVSAGWVVGMIALMLALEVIKAAVPATIIDGLRLPQSFVAEEAAGTVSRLVPGPSGTAARLAIYRSWGLKAEDFGRATVVNSILNNAVVLTLPALAVLPLAVDHHIPRTIWVISAIGLAVAGLGAYVMTVVARNEAAALRLGRMVGRLVGRVNGLRRRPPPDDMGPEFVRFRDTTLRTLTERWRRLIPLILTKNLLVASIMFIALRSLGIGPGTLTFFDVVAVFVFGGLFTMIQVTPGGLGVDEIVYIELLTLVSGGHDRDALVGAVLLFRAVTFLGPIVLGAIALVVWRQAKGWRVGTSPHANLLVPRSRP